VTRRRTVVFDVGGVIVRWQPEALMRQCFPQHAVDDASAERIKTQVFQSFAEGADWAAFDRGQVEPEALADRIAERSGLPHRGVTALIDAIPDHLQPMPESLALIERVRAAGHCLALLSNMPLPYAEHLERSHACFGWFEHRTWSGRLGAMKPDRAIFDHVREGLALDLEDAIFLDDHAGNIDAARRFGWNALHFESAAQAECQLVERGWLSQA
jgi:putative hydrolase of the HAD superfamily